MSFQLFKLDALPKYFFILCQSKVESQTNYTKLLEMKSPPPSNQRVLLRVKTTLKYGSFKNCGQKHRMHFSNMKDRCDSKRRINIVYFVVGYEIAG